MNENIHSPIALKSNKMENDVVENIRRIRAPII